MKVKITVEGEDFEYEVGQSEKLSAVASAAIAKSGRRDKILTAQWEIRDERGTLLYDERSLADYDLKEGTQLFVMRAVGCGG